MERDRRTEEHWRTWLDDVPLTLVVDLDGWPVGVVGGAGPDRSEIEFFATYLATGARGQGVGDALAEAALDWGRDQGANGQCSRCSRRTWRRSTCTGGRASPTTGGPGRPYLARAMTRDLEGD
jgi:GNAT superfamily N-acetyltransferase